PIPASTPFVDFLPLYKRPFRNAQKPSGTPDAENRVYPGNERAIADIWDQCLPFIGKPLLIPKKQENNYHRCVNQVVIKIVFRNTQLFHSLLACLSEVSERAVRPSSSRSNLGGFRENVQKRARPRLEHEISLLLERGETARCPSRTPSPGSSPEPRAVSFQIAAICSGKSFAK